MGNVFLYREKRGKTFSRGADNFAKYSCLLRVFVPFSIVCTIDRLSPSFPSTQKFQLPLINLDVYVSRFAKAPCKEYQLERNPQSIRGRHSQPRSVGRVSYTPASRLSRYRDSTRVGNALSSPQTERKESSRSRPRGSQCPRPVGVQGPPAGLLPQQKRARAGSLEGWGSWTILLAASREARPGGMAPTLFTPILPAAVAPAKDDIRSVRH